MVDELGRSLLTSLGAPTGARSHIEAYTEVVLKKGEGKHRPDGLIVVRSGGKIWSALIEAKVGNSELTNEQVEAYLEIARLNGCNALITVSNQFASLPTHHPLQVSASSRRKVELFHWSWMYVVTQSTLLLSHDDVSDREKRILLREMNRFLLHESSGVKAFEQMPASWSDVVAKVQAGGSVAANSAEAKEVVGAWHQEVGNLSLTLSRQLETAVKVRMPRAHATDAAARQKEDQKALSNTSELNTELVVPDAADVIKVCADLKKRSITASIWLKAPDEPKTTKARVNWLLRQLQKTEPAGIYVRCFWPGKTRATLHALTALRDNPELVAVDHESQSVVSFEVMMVRDAGARFGQRRNFVADLETTVPAFYNQAGQWLKAWQARAPKLRDDKTEPQEVAPKALRDELELDALSGDA